MSQNYFKQLKEKTGTGFWINNPTSKELEPAIEEGALNCTTNPAYCSRLIAEEPQYIHWVIDQAIKENSDYEYIIKKVCSTVTKRLMERYEKIYRDTGGKSGFVTMQEDPRRDEDADYIVANALQNRNSGGNYMAKIPVIKGGIEAIEACIKADIPVCATEVFSISQAMDISDVYVRACKESGNKPTFFVTHISGIFDEYLGKVALREGIPIDEQVIAQAGLAIARKEYQMIQKHGYPVIMLGGGARGVHHFTGLVGGDAHITINWSTARDIMSGEHGVESMIDYRTDQKVINELSDKFPDFKKAYEDNGLERDQYAGFGPVQLFRNAFIKGWYILLSEIASRKHLHAL